MVKLISLIFGIIIGIVKGFRTGDWSDATVPLVACGVVACIIGIGLGVRAIVKRRQGRDGSN